MEQKRILSLLGSDWDRMQAVIRDALHTDVRLLEETNVQILGSPGKMLRPMMSLLMAKACGSVSDAGIRCAAASEMLHNATLMHDDVADDSRERRGRPSVMSMVGPNAAVLLGDFWLARAVETVLGAGCKDRLVPVFSKTLTDLAEGEMLQLQKASAADTTEDDYMRIIYCKTASLFETACVSAAISAEAPDEYVEAARSYACNAGYAFQIKDDILDYAGDEALGKPVGVDLKEKKITLPLLAAMASDTSKEKEIREMVRTMDTCPDNCGRVRGFVLRSDGVGAAAAKLGIYVGKAVDALSPLPDSPAKEMLADIARYNTFRKI